ncbi:TPA: S-layer family protein, partial [Neisseria meningitidis]
GVSIHAAAALDDARIIIGASEIKAPSGSIDIKAHSDIVLEAGQNDAYTFLKTKGKSGKIIRKTKFTSTRDHLIMPAPVELTANGITLQAGGNIEANTTRFNAPAGKVTLVAGEELQLLAEEGIHKHELDVQKSRRFIGIKVGKSNYSKNELNETKLPVRVVAQTAATRSGWDTVLEGTEFKTTLAGADIQAGVGEKARVDAKIILKGIVNRIQSEEKLETNSTVWQKQAGRGSTIETLKLPSFESPTPPKLSAPGGYIVDIPKGNLKTEIEKLSKQPEYAYLKQLQVAKNINWNQVQLAYDRWDYKQEGLTEAGAAIIALAVTVVTSGAGTGAVLGLNGAAAAATDAAFASLASQASVSFINNKGDVGKTLKELGRSSTVKNLVVAAATAGVADKIGASALNNVSDKQWINNLTVNLANAGSAALINTAINGGSLKDNLGDAALGAIVSTVHGEVASKIKFNLSEDYITHKIAHAIAGCAAAAANKGKCQDGAIGAAVGEIVGEALVKNTDFSRMSATEIEKAKAKITAYSKLVAGTASAVVGGDVNTAANAATVAVENNSLFQPQTTLEAGVRNAILRGDIQELRLLLGEANFSTADAAYAQRILASMEKIGESNSRLLAERYGVDWLNKVHHIFKGHQGSIGNTLIQKSGSMENAVVATQKAVDALKLTKTGNYPVTVTVNGITVIVRVYVNNGVSRIATILKM